MLSKREVATPPLPKNWKRGVRSAVLNVISLAQLSIAYARGWAANSINARVRLKAENDRLREEVALLREEMRIKDSRMTLIVPQRRPHYAPTERMAILELRAARGWSLSQSADSFLVTSATIASWVKRIDEEGPESLVQICQPVNKFPDFVRYVVQRLKVLCPRLGKVKIAQILSRAGLHLGVTTIGRMLKESPRFQPTEIAESSGRIVTAKRPNHVWHVDLTVVPTSKGFWTSWIPFSRPQQWPFCWWVAVAIDHYSRRIMGFAVFTKLPESAAVRAFLGRAIAHAKEVPKYIISDKGKQFWCDGYRNWCRRKGIKPRFGAAGERGSIAVVERFILTLKNDGTRRIQIPFRRPDFSRELRCFLVWYNQHRPHMALAGRTPQEVCFKTASANELGRIEPRSRWPRGAPCAAPRVPKDGEAGVELDLRIGFHAGRRHLPIVTLKRAA
jgi:putative transposase